MKPWIATSFFGGFYAYGVTKYVGIPILVAALMIV